MYECTEVAQVARLSGEINDAYLEDVDARLLHIERTVIPASAKMRHVLDRLSERLFQLHEKGFTCKEIAGLLESYEIRVSAEMVEDYISHAQTKRLMSCEETIAHSYKPEWNAALERSALIERGLRQALRDELGLVLMYQPQVDIRTGEVLGAEALLRWNFNGTMIKPVEFIPIAEAAGLIVPIGEWVLREACREAKRWQTMGFGGSRGIKMGVNLSVKQFSEKLPDIVHGILCDTNLPADMLGLEITESFLVGNGSLAVLTALRNSGIHLSIDDFGTGYSCLSHLKDLPLDTIKIDRAFVSDLGHGGSSSAVVSAIIDLAGKLKMDTLAEGVETPAQAQALTAMGCRVCQGYLFSRPLASEDFIEFLRAAPIQLVIEDSADEVVFVERDGMI